MNKCRFTTNYVVLGLYVPLFFFLPLFVSAGTISAPVQNTGLVGYWDFELGKDGMTVYDMSGNRNHGTLTNMNPSTDWTDGKIGTGLNMPGADDFVSIPDKDSLDVARVTVALWVYPTSSSNFQGLIAKPTFSGSFELYKNPTSNTVTWRINDSTGQVNTSVGLTLNQWNHVAATYDGSEMCIFFDGVSKACGPRSVTMETNASAIQIGDHGSVQGPVFGKFDEVRVYNRGLSAEEIARLYRQSASRFNASSVGKVANGITTHWTFDGNDMAPRVMDRGGQNNHGTLAGFTSTTTTIGALGQALQFDGADDYFFSSTDTVTSIPYSVSLWFKTPGFTGSSRVLFAQARSGSCGERPYLWLSTALKVGITTGSGTQCGESITSQSSSVSANAWHHVVLVAASTASRKVYVDNQLVIDDTGTVGVSTDGCTFVGAFQLGSCTAPSNYFKGDIDDVRIYNRAVTTDEIDRLYTMGVPSKLNKTPTGGRLAEGLVGHWTFDGPDMVFNANKALDISGQGNHGTLIGMSTTTSPVFGRLGQALQGDGTDDQITFNGALTTNATVAGWFYVDSSDVDVVIWRDHTSDPGTGWIPFFNNGGSLAYRLDGTTDTSATTYASIQNRWTHLAVTKSGSTAVLYVDGAQVDTGTGFTSSTSANPWHIFQNGTITTEVMKGKADDLRIYSRSLSADEVKQLYNMGR